MTATNRDTLETTKDKAALVDYDYNALQDAPPNYDDSVGQHYPGSHNMVVVAQPVSTVAIERPESPPDAAGFICLSCFVFWCCCWPLGLAAFVIAVNAASGNTATAARKQLKNSAIVSVIGILIGMLLLPFVIIRMKNQYEARSTDNYSY